MDEKITVWIARDKSGILFIYTRKPVKGKYCSEWHLDAKKPGGIGMELDKEKFPQVKWEDAEPTKAELTIKICK